VASDTDVFISYSHADAAWVHTLADNLHQLGLEVWIDRWRISPGDRFVHAIEQGLLKARNGVLIVTPAALVTTVSRPIAHRRRSRPTAEGVDEGGVLRKAEQESQL
jgi:TIR domain